MTIPSVQHLIIKTIYFSQKNVVTKYYDGDTGEELTNLQIIEQHMMPDACYVKIATDDYFPMIEDACRAFVGDAALWNTECGMDTGAAEYTDCDNETCMCHLSEDSDGSESVRQFYRRAMERALKAIRVIR